MKSKINRRMFLKAVGIKTAALTIPAFLIESGLSDTNLKRGKPNFTIIFCDDLGYSDLGCYGHPTINTPNIDRMAAEGQKWTDFYVAASVCTPSRAALLTGRLPVRNGMCSDEHSVLTPNSGGGLPQQEITIAEALKTKGYTTACIGKWHLGHLPQYLPTNNGFDYYYGIPYSNNMDPTAKCVRGVEGYAKAKPDWFNVPLMRNEKIIERPANQYSLTKCYTQESVKFIKQNKKRPFFLYLSHTFPHVPLFASKNFDGKSRRGLYGDVVEELDWSVGKILKTLKQEHLAKNTLVIFTSDNGPWLVQRQFAGSAGLLREGKGTTWEGGMRVPCIMWWPGKIKPSVVNGIGSTMDVFTTLIKLGKAPVPADRIIDGVDLRPVLLGTGPSPRKVMFCYNGTKLYAVRKGPYKAHFFTKPSYAFSSEPEETKHDPPLLYHLGHDPSEKYDISKKHPDVIANIRKEAKKHLAKLTPGENQLVKKIKQNN